MMFRLAAMRAVCSALGEASACGGEAALLDVPDAEDVETELSLEPPPHADSKLKQERSSARLQCRARDDRMVLPAGPVLNASRGFSNLSTLTSEASACACNEQ